MRWKQNTTFINDRSQMGGCSPFVWEGRLSGTPLLLLERVTLSSVGIFRPLQTSAPGSENYTTDNIQKQKRTQIVPELCQVCTIRYLPNYSGVSH